MNGGKSPMTNNIYFDNRDKSGAKYFRRVRRVEQATAIFLGITYGAAGAFGLYGLAVLVGWV
jgi:hypothetical protein